MAAGSQIIRRVTLGASLGLVGLLGGCGPNVGEMVATSRKVDARAARFHEKFPHAQASTSSWYGTRHLFAAAALGEGYSLILDGQFPGSSSDEYHSTSFALRNPAGEVRPISGEDFDALVDSQNPLELAKQLMAADQARD
jgi:hypothetical protein